MIQGSLSGITAYIDGACSGNPGPGGWGVVVVTPSGTRDSRARIPRRRTTGWSSAPSSGCWNTSRPTSA